MSETTHPGDATHGEHTGTAPHGATHSEGGHADAGHGGHEHGMALGPIDWRAWGAGVLGVAGGLAVAACLWLATHP
jgi:hypothetical protein